MPGQATWERIPFSKVRLKEEIGGHVEEFGELFRLSLADPPLAAHPFRGDAAGTKYLERKWEEVERGAKPAGPEIQHRIAEARKRPLAKRA